MEVVEEVITVEVLEVVEMAELILVLVSSTGACVESVKMETALLNVCAA